MVSMTANRRTAVERLAFACLIVGGGLLWGRVVAIAASGSDNLSSRTIQPDGAVVDWQPLSAALTALATPDARRTAPEGR